MLFRIILISYLLTSEGYGTSQENSEMYSYKTDSYIPEYCKELNQIYNHDYIEKWSKKEDSYLCIDGQEQGFKYEELMNEARAITYLSRVTEVIEFGNVITINRVCNVGTSCNVIKCM